MIFSHANLENKNQLVLKLLEEVTKNGNKLSILTDELKSILEDLANLTGPEYHQVKRIVQTRFCDQRVGWARYCLYGLIISSIPLYL